MKHIGVIGAGFSGTMVAVNVIREANQPLEISVIDSQANLNLGVAYNAYSNTHLLNVTCAKMSAYTHEPNHFLDWVLCQPTYKGMDANTVAASFLPRRLYGRYLQDLWKDAVATATEKQITLQVIDTEVMALEATNSAVTLVLKNETVITVDAIVIATGNHAPRHPKIENMAFYMSKNYYQNPWRIDSITNPNTTLPILIIGNGLTMVDTVLALREQGLNTPIISLSPNGFNLIAHEDITIKYTGLTDELDLNLNLYELVTLVNKHVKILKQQGHSPYIAIASLRPFSQTIWKHLSLQDKSRFMSRCRHLWNMARHRIPMQSFQTIKTMQKNGELMTLTAKLIDLQETPSHSLVTYLDKKQHRLKELKVSRVINCTGPESDVTRIGAHFLKNCINNKTLTQDALKLGIHADTETFQAIAGNGTPHPHIYIIGANLKGDLWESTAVQELRQQAEHLASLLKRKPNLHPTPSGRM